MTIRLLERSKTLEGYLESFYVLGLHYPVFSQNKVETYSIMSEAETFIESVDNTAYFLN